MSKKSANNKNVSGEQLVDEIIELFDEMKEIIVEYKKYAESYEKDYFNKKKKVKIEDRHKYKNNYIKLKQTIRGKINKLEELNNDNKFKYNNKIKKYKDKLNGYINEYRSLTDRIVKINLDNDESFEEPIEKPVATAKNNDQVIIEINKINAKVKADLEESVEKIYEMKEIGTSAMTTLISDGEKLENVRNNVDTIDSELVIAKKRITIMFKRIYTDKILMTFILLICAIIVTIIVLRNTKKI